MAGEIDDVFEIIESSKNFLLSGGAGSGKTYSLVEVLKKIYSGNPKTKVACITFTNVAVKEIKERAPFNNLEVLTIHEFLWSVISNYQKNLKIILAELIEDGTISYSGEEELVVNYYDDRNIDYREWKNLEDGIICHDEVIALAERMFEKYELLSDIVKDTYNFILIDEYQDTFKSVVSIFLDRLGASEKKNIIGFFGDSMQSIYDHGVGNISQYVNEGSVVEIKKKDNRRNPKIIIDLINKLRLDDLEQNLAPDISAPNHNIVGSIKFIYTKNEGYDISKIKQNEVFIDFDFNNASENKELYLVHNLISDKVGFDGLMGIYARDGIIRFSNSINRNIKRNGIDIEKNKTFEEVIDLKILEPSPRDQVFIDENSELFEMAKGYKWEDFKKIYSDKDQLIGYKKGDDSDRNTMNTLDHLINHLFQIQHCIYLYQNKRHNEFIRKTHFSIKSINDKKKLKDDIDKLASMSDSKIEEVIDFADSSGIWKKHDKLKEFIQRKEYIYNRVKEVEYQEFINLYNYLEDYTPYSTQHGIKGAEFDNVFVILDNGKWNNFNFKYLFEKQGNENVINRTAKLFYVCCSRAKKNLVVYYNNPTDKVIETAKEWFGEENVIDIT